jgi:thiosulfate/3-mercaptopyruvate sulfurtransferase
MSEYAHPESLVSTKWLTDHLDDPNVRIVEVIMGSNASFGMPAYEAGHIPGAVVWDYEKDYLNPDLGELVDKSNFEKQLSRSGIQSATTVVLYSGLNNMLATFEFWLMKFYGHKDVRLLDGGRQKWLDESHPTTSTVPSYTPTSYQAQEPNLSLRARHNDVLQAIRKETIVLVDARSVQMYRGEEKPGTQRGGHIPGAINLAAQRVFNPDGSVKGWAIPTAQPDETFKQVQELQALFDKLGITRDREIITYCLRGGVSTHAWFVLTQLLGYPNVREYDRSWAEWGNLEGAPVET